MTPLSLAREFFAGTRVGGWVVRTGLVTGAVLIAVGAASLLVPQIRAVPHTGLFVLQILDVSFKPQPWFTTEPLRQEVTYPRPDGQGVADIYRIPDNRRRAAVLIFLGANAAGRDDKDVINLGNALARAGFVVMFHWSPTMGLHHNVDPDEIENLVWAFQYLESQEFVDRERAGVGGFSVGGSFALVAAADPRIRDQVLFVNSFGAYYDAQDLFLQIASGARFYEGRWERWEVDRLTWLVFANELIETLEAPEERELFARRFLRSEEVPPEELEGLSEQAETIRVLLEGTTPEKAEELFKTLPQNFREDMARISPSAHVPKLTARLMIMHDEGDLLIPVVESRRLAAALQDRGNFRYTETQVFEHVRPGSSGGIWQLLTEAAKLYRHMYGIIRVAV